MDKVKYFRFKVKLGHVGRDKYLPMEIGVRAKSEKRAVTLARKHGGVKRDHKDWCLEKPIEITKEEYDELIEKYRKDEYWEGDSRKNREKFKDRLVDEPNYSRVGNFKTNKKKIIKTTKKDSKKYKLKKDKIITKQTIKENLKDY